MIYFDTSEHPPEKQISRYLIDMMQVEKSYTIYNGCSFGGYYDDYPAVLTMYADSLRSRMCSVVMNAEIMISYIGDDIYIHQDNIDIVKFNLKSIVKTSTCKGACYLRRNNHKPNIILGIWLSYNIDIELEKYGFFCYILCHIDGYILTLELDIPLRREMTLVLTHILEYHDNSPYVHVKTEDIDTYTYDTFPSNELHKALKSDNFGIWHEDSIDDESLYDEEQRRRIIYVDKMILIRNLYDGLVISHINGTNTFLRELCCNSVFIEAWKIYPNLLTDEDLIVVMVVDSKHLDRCFKILILSNAGEILRILSVPSDSKDAKMLNTGMRCIMDTDGSIILYDEVVWFKIQRNRRECDVSADGGKWIYDSDDLLPSNFDDDFKSLKSE